MAFFPAKQCFEKVIQKKGAKNQDYWFVWPGDYEPVRITYNGKLIVAALHRFHWAHVHKNKPYNDENNRLHVFFWWGGYTPQVKTKKDDRIFDALIESFDTEKNDAYKTIDEEVPNYFTSKGFKSQHLPPVYYGGWPLLV